MGFFHARPRRSCHASDPFRLDIWKAKELYLQLPEWVRPGSVATCPQQKQGAAKGLKKFKPQESEKPWGEIVRNHEKPVKNHDTCSFFLEKVTFLRVNTEAYWWSTSQHRVLPVQIRDVCSRTRQAISLGQTVKQG